MHARRIGNLEGGGSDIHPKPPKLRKLRRGLLPAFNLPYTFHAYLLLPPYYRVKRVSLTLARDAHSSWDSLGFLFEVIGPQAKLALLSLGCRVGTLP